MKSTNHKKQKSKTSKPPIIQLIAISLLIILIVLLGAFDLKLGSWFAPTQYLKVDSAGIHFYSGWSDPSALTWHLEGADRTEVSKVSVTSLGYYNFPLPTVSGDYHLYCTGASGCDAGDWFRINLSVVPKSPADVIISGWCTDGNNNALSCTGASSTFRFTGGSGTPSNWNCNTCSPRDVNSVPGYDTSAKIVSAPPIPTPTPTPTSTPVVTTIPQPTPTPIVTPIIITEETKYSNEDGTESGGVVTTIITCPEGFNITEYNTCVQIPQTPTKQSGTNGIPAISMTSIVLIIGLSYHIIKKTKKG